LVNAPVWGGDIAGKARKTRTKKKQGAAMQKTGYMARNKDAAPQMQPARAVMNSALNSITRKKATEEE